MNYVLPVEWVRMDKYCDLVGMPVESARHLVKQGRWLEGKHWRLGPDRRRWVNIKRVQEWVENGHLQAV